MNVLLRDILIYAGFYLGVDNFIDLWYLYIFIKHVYFIIIVRHNLKLWQP